MVRGRARAGIGAALLAAAVAAALLFRFAAGGEPVVLKLAFFSSDRTHLYLSSIKPFVDAVNAEGAGRVRIDVHFSGGLGKDLTKQTRLLRDGLADIAHVVPSYESASFSDAAVIELPGLFKDAREATLAAAQLIETDVIRGFKDYFVIGVYVTEPETVHSRTRIASLADLDGRRIRVSNDTEMDVLSRLGVVASFIPLYEVASAISHGEVDGALGSPITITEFGIGRVATNHYFLPTSCVAHVLMMTRARFDGLPADVQALIRKFSGRWFGDTYIRINEAVIATIMKQLADDPRRKIVFPSGTDRQRAEAIFRAVADDYAAQNIHNAALVEAARAAVTALRDEVGR